MLLRLVTRTRKREEIGSDWSKGSEFRHDGFQSCALMCSAKMAASSTVVFAWFAKKVDPEYAQQTQKRQCCKEMDMVKIESGNPFALCVHI